MVVIFDDNYYPNTGGKLNDSIVTQSLFLSKYLCDLLAKAVLALQQT